MALFRPRSRVNFCAARFSRGCDPVRLIGILYAGCWVFAVALKSNGMHKLYF